MSDYWDPMARTIEVAVWAAATQVQFERWEPRVAQRIAAELDPARLMPASSMWQTSMDRHFLIVAADHLVTATKFAQFPVAVPEHLADELEDGRDLLEHWKEQAPTFTATPRPMVPDKPKGPKRFDANNPQGDPYWSFDWDNRVGPKVLPNVPAAELKAVVEAIKTRVVSDLPELAVFFHEWEPSPWIGGVDWTTEWLPSVLAEPLP